MSLEKITTQQMDAKGVCSAPDVLSGTPAQNKAVFDRMVRELVAPAYNAAVDAINAMENTEDGVKAAEALRVAAEKLRAAAETARAEAESGRAEAEQQRQAAETQRQDLETGYVARSENGAKASESWAVGGTGTREGEDTNNAKYWSEKAKETAGGDFIPNSARGVPDGVATLGKDGKVPSDQIPAMDYVPATEKGAENGIATLGADGKLTASQIPEQKIMAITNAAEYSATAAYAEGAYCTRSGKLYRCTTAITEAEDWTEAHWTETSVGAELTELARQLSESGGVSMKLLWENASPSSPFPAQTIAVDYSEYQLLLFVCNDHVKSEYGAPSRIISGIVNVANEPSGVLRGTSTQPSKRNYSLQNNQIIFSVASVAHEFGKNTWGEAPNTLIPVRIYGIKGIA